MAITDGGNAPRGASRLRANVPGMGGGGAGGIGGMEVYLGDREISSRVRKNIKELGGRSSGKVDEVGTVDDVTKMFFKWSEQRRKNILNKAVLGGLLPEDAGIMEASSLWRKLVEEAAKYRAAGAKMTPFDVLASYLQGAGADEWVRQGDFEVNKRTGERRYVGPRFKTVTNKEVDLTDPRTAQAIATALFQDMMGRNPGKGELQTFAQALEKAERANPVRSTTRTEFDMTTGDPIAKETTSSGGLSAEARAMIGQNQIKDDDEYGVFQAGTTYYNALEQAVYGSPG